LGLIKKATLPVQQFIPLQNKQIAQNSLAEHLPSPLYILFYQTSIYRDTIGNSYPLFYKIF
jgi:hypothetical protein